MQSDYRVKMRDCFSSSSSSYIVQHILGNGAFGQVALCHKSSTNRMVVLKVLSASLKDDDALHEARIHQMLQEKGSRSHHIVQWIDSFVYKGHYCQEFEKLDINLTHFLSTCPYKSLPLKHIRPIITQTARALQFLKANGIIHCDLRPSNIMMINKLDQPFRIKLIDFGLARHVSQIQHGDMVQPLKYRAPEVEVGTAITEAIDIWSVGCIAAQILQGATLFNASDSYDLMRHIVQIVGQPPKQVLDSGIRTHEFFHKPKQFTDWLFISRFRQPATPLTISSLDEIYNRYPFNDEETTRKAEKDDCRLFGDLLKRMLDLDPASRFTPEDILNHPFITMTHLRSDFPLYYKECHTIMEQVMNVSDEKEQQSSSTSSTKMSEEEDATVASQGQKSLRKRSKEEEEEAPRNRLKKKRNTSRNSQTKNEATKKSLKEDDTALQNSRKGQSSSSQEYRKKRLPRKRRQSNDAEEEQHSSSTKMCKAEDTTVATQGQKSSRKRSNLVSSTFFALRERLHTARQRIGLRKKSGKRTIKSYRTVAKRRVDRKEMRPLRTPRQSNDSKEEQHSPFTSSTQMCKVPDEEEEEEVPRKRLRKEHNTFGNSQIDEDLLCLLFSTYCSCSTPKNSSKEDAKTLQNSSKEESGSSQQHRKEMGPK